MAGSGLFSDKRPVVPHLVAQGSAQGIAGEVADLRADVLGSLTPLAAITVEEFTNVPAPSINAIKLAAPTVAQATVYHAADFNGAIGAAVLHPPRNITVTTGGATPANAPASVIVAGVDANGKAISETLTIAQTASTVAGLKAFSKVTTITLPVADGTAATLAFGFGPLIGLGKKIKSRAGLAFIWKEISAGAIVTTGVLAAPAVGLPNGTYAPAAPPDGVLDYAIYYEYDPLA